MWCVKEYPDSYFTITSFILKSIVISDVILRTSCELETSSSVEQNVFLRSPRSHSNFASPDYFSSSRKYSLETDSNENSHHEHFNQKSSHEQQYSKSANDYDGRLQDSFFKYVKRSKDYDRNEVPWDGKKGLKPVEIQMSAYLRNVLNVDEPSQLISVETSLRMTWKDPRLNVTTNDALSDDFILFGPDVMKYIWVPDVYIDGVQELRSPAYKLIPAYLRIYNDSRLKYSARVNYDVACPMNFKKYPLDIQHCNISFEPWGHPSEYIVLKWLREKRKFSSTISLAQFDLDVNFLQDASNNFSSLGSYSRITMQLVLSRKITYHLFRTYLPSGLFVIIGWFSLFIPIDHVPGRVTMGMTTILTLAAMFSAMATTTPRISYSSKLDVWMVFCVIFVFGTLMEFALLICLEKHVFDAQIKKSLAGLSAKRKRSRLERELKRNDSVINSHSVSETPNIMKRATGSVNSGVEKLVSGSPQLQNTSKKNGINVKNGSYRRVHGKKRQLISTMSFGHQIDQSTIEPLTMNEIVSAARRQRNIGIPDNCEIYYEDLDLEYEKILEQQERNKELLFVIERYGIIMFALFFIFFNIMYWLHILWIL